MKTSPPEIRHFYTSQCWMESAALDQLHQMASLPGVLFAAGFPDLHPGKGVPNGAVAVSSTHLYPHLIGNDVGCGLALWQAGLPARKLKLDRLEKSLHGLEQTPEKVPGSILENHDLTADSLDASFGTIGGGNHFAELLAVEEVCDEAEWRRAAGDDGNVFLLVHSGSRALGDRLYRRHAARFGARGLTAGSDEAEAYRRAHDHAARWAAANRALIAERLLGDLRTEAACLLDAAHNSLTKESLGTDEVWIHRKGAAPTRGNLVVIPGTRGTLSYLVRPVGDQTANAYSVAHGAGRKWRRSECRGRLEKRYRTADLTRTKLKSRVVCEDRDLLYEEAPEAYKDIRQVIGDLVHFGLIEVVATLRPLLTYKTRRSER
ncbi:MAG: RNA ligase RtcB family protein [Verrucomicrobiota bacterium]